MKKIFVIIAIFILALFVFYQMSEYEESTLVSSVKDTKIRYRVLSQKNERITAQKKIVIEEKKFIVDIGSDRNVSRDSDITLSATVKNIESSDMCNYFWREDGEIIGMGSSIERKFSKGEHIIAVQAVDSKGREANDTIKIIAWDYHIIKKYHYSVSTGEYTHTEIDIFDHRGNYLLMDDGVFSKYTLVYNDDGRQIETTSEYYQYPEENMKKLYTYDGNGHIDTVEILNADDIMVSFHIYEYDEDGNQISAKSGTSEDNLTEDEVYVYSEPISEDNSTNSDNNSSVNIYNERGALVYSEEDYVYFKEINEYSYDESGKLIKSISSSVSGDENESRISHYDENGSTISTEIVYKSRGETTCRYSTQLTYTKQNYISTRTNKILDGDCSIVEAGYVSYTYDDVGNVLEMKSKLSLDDDSSEYTTLKTIIYYSNELE